MKKKEKKKLKKKARNQMPGTTEIQADSQDLVQRVKQLERELKQRESTIETMTHQIKESKTKKKKKRKSGKSALKVLFAQQATRVGVAQKKAWERHGYLRDRYEFHLENGRAMTDARHLADKDLREKFGEDAGYSEQELDQILS